MIGARKEGKGSAAGGFEAGNPDYSPLPLAHSSSSSTSSIVTLRGPLVPFDGLAVLGAVLR